MLMLNKFLVYLQLTIGSILFALGIELILVPNNLIDSGVAGVSIMVNHLSNMPTWLSLIVINGIILLFTSKFIGKIFVVRTIYANIISSISLQMMHHFDPIINGSELLVIIYGGLIIGLGVGLVVRNDAAIDGTEMIALWLNKKTGKPITTILIAVNCFVFAAAAFVYGLQNALLSITTFYIVSRAIEYVLDDLYKAKSIFIISQKPTEVGEALIAELELSLTYLHGTGGYSKEEQQIVYCISDRIMFPRIKKIVLDTDPSAILEASYVTESAGVSRSSLMKKFKK